MSNSFESTFIRKRDIESDPLTTSQMVFSKLLLIALLLVDLVTLSLRQILTEVNAFHVPCNGEVWL